jgi:hypothetical protein
VAGVIAVAIVCGVPWVGAAAAVSSQSNAVQLARSAARSAERLDAAKLATQQASRAAAAANAKAARTHSFGNVVQAREATARAASLGAAQARAQLAYNRASAQARKAAATAARQTARAKAKSALDVEPGGAGLPGTLNRTTATTVANAQRDADQACRRSAGDVTQVTAAQTRLTDAQANPRSTPEEIAALQADLTAKQADAAASAAACTAAQANAVKEAASFAGFNDGTSVEGAPSVVDTQPFPDNLDSCPTTTGPTTPCHSDNLELVGSTHGNQTGGSNSCPAFNPTKCPGFSALNFVTGYKHLGYDFMIANGTSGLSVWSLKDPAQPQFISSIPWTSLVSGVSGAAGTQFWEGENETVDSARKLVFMSRDVGVKGLFIVDLKDPWHPQLLGFQKVPQGHTATCINGCRFLWSVGGVASGSGTGFTGKSAPVSVTDMRDPAHPFTYTTAVQANVQRTNSTSGSTHSVDVDFDGVAWVSASSGVRGYWTSGKHYNPVTNALEWATPYAPLPYGGGRITGNTSSFMHNSYHFPNALGSQPAGDVMLVTNENNNTNCSSAGVFIIASLNGTYDDHGLVVKAPATVPQMDRLATFSPGGKVGQFHGTVGSTQVGDCSAHWFTVRGNLVAQAYYEQGLRIIDVSNPTAPVQVGYARVPVRAASGDTPAIVSSDSAGAYWHGHYIYLADYQRGIDVYRYTDPIPGVIEAKTCWNSCEK